MLPIRILTMEEDEIVMLTFQVLEKDMDNLMMGVDMMSKFGLAIEYSGREITCKFKNSSVVHHLQMTGVEEDGEIGMIDSSPITFTDIAQLQAEADIPQDWSTVTQVSHTTDAKQIVTRPSKGKAHTIGTHTLAKILFEGQERQLLLDSGAACSVVGLNFLEKIVPDWEEKIAPVNNMRFRGCSEPLEALGVIELPIIFPHSQGSVRIKPDLW